MRGSARDHMPVPMRELERVGEVEPKKEEEGEREEVRDCMFV